MGYRETPEGKHQAAILRAAEKASERKRSAIVAGLPMEHDQYKRYLRGDTPLKWDQIPVFAAAYGIPIHDLAHGLGLVEPDDPTWDFLAELKRAKPDDPEGAEQTYRNLATAPQYVQREVVKAILDAARQEREGDTRASQKRAGAEEQAHYRISATG